MQLSTHCYGVSLPGGRVCHVRDILREFPGHNFVSGLRTLKPKNNLKPKKF